MLHANMNCCAYIGATLKNTEPGMGYSRKNTHPRRMANWKFSQGGGEEIDSSGNPRGRGDLNRTVTSDHPPLPGLPPSSLTLIGALTMKNQRDKWTTASLTEHTTPGTFLRFPGHPSLCFIVTCIDPGEHPQNWAENTISLGVSYVVLFCFIQTT